MLQFITKPSSQYSMPEEARMALEGGCRWIELSSEGLDQEENVLKDIAKEIMQLCEDKEAFLIIDDDVELVDELKVHGLLMHDNSRGAVMEARERLGADAVIGVAVKSAAEAKYLAGLDVDYLEVPVDETCTDKGAFYSEIVQALTDANLDFHVVACGALQPSDYEAVLKAGCSGVAVSGEIADAENPVEATAEICAALDAARKAADADML